MDYKNLDERRVVRHLLRQLPEPEETALARRRAEDPQYDEWCRAIEQELIDDFLQRRLPPEDAARFERCYLSTPDGVRKLEFARALQRSLAARRRTITFHHGRGMAVAAAVLVLLVAGTITALSRSPRAAVTYTLLPGVLRGIEPSQEARVPESARTVRFRLRLDELSGRADRAEIRAVGVQKAAWAKSLKPPGAGIAEVTIPASQLPSGDYVLMLTARGEPVESFAFRLSR